MDAVHLEAVTKRYDNVVALRDVSMSIGTGEMFGLIGPDGAGKTTAIRLMCGLLKPDAGSVRVMGRDPVKQHREVTQVIGYLSQRFSLYGDLSIDENISFFAEMPITRAGSMTYSFLINGSVVNPMNYLPQ